MTSHVSPDSGMDPAASNADPAARPFDEPGAPSVPILIESKLTPPPVAVGIERARLLLSLAAAADRRLVVVAAPGGYGKSTLLRHWRAGVTAGRALAWLSLDTEDDQPGSFFRYLSAAISTAAEGLVVDASGPPGTNAILAALARATEPLWIVLDDFHQISDPALLQEISFLIRRAPPTIHWVVAGRCIPELDLSQHKLHDQLALFDTGMLAFNCEDIAELAQRAGLALDARQIEDIHARTEGWPAGVKLTLLTADEQGNLAEPDVILNGEVARYFSSVILAAESLQVRELLQLSAVVDSLNADLCNVLLGIEHGAQLLEEFERRQLFIRRVTECGWYRYHRMFLEFLRSLPPQSPAHGPQLHRRASHWYAAQQLHEAALYHAFSSGDHDWCVELTARCARHWLKIGEIGLILQWVGRLRRSEIVSHELIGPIYITCLIWRRRYKEAMTALDETRTALLVLGEQTPVTAARMRTLQVMLDILSGSTENIDLSETQSADGRDTFLTATLMALQAYWLLGRCRFDLARRLALRAREVMQQHDSLYALNYVNGVIALADRGQGDFASARAAVERMYAAAGDRRGPTWAHAAALHARMRYEQNHVAEAAGLFIEVLPQLAGGCTVEHFTAAHIALARLKASQGAFTESFELLDYLHSMIERDGAQNFLGNVCYEKIRLHLQYADRDRALALAIHFGLPQRLAAGEWQEPREYSMPWEQFGLAQAALLLDAQQYDACRTLLNTLLASVYSVGFICRAVPLEAGLAVCEWRAGEQSAAFAAINRGMLLTRKIGFTRCAFDEAPGLAQIISAALVARRLQHALPPQYFERFQDFFDAAALAHGPRSLPLEPLTTRELELLALLAQGMSNREISARSQIALSTTKWHLKNVFAKLGVNTRTGALARAKELRLIA